MENSRVLLTTESQPERLFESRLRFKKEALELNLSQDPELLYCREIITVRKYYLIKRVILIET